MRLCVRLAKICFTLLLLLGLIPGCQKSVAVDVEKPTPGEWLTYGGSLARNFSRADEAILTRENVDRLVPLWRFTTGAVVTASPIVAWVEFPDGTRVKMVFISSWDGNFYALRADDGSLVWSYRFKPHPGASFPNAGSAAVADIDGRRQVFVAGGMTMYALEAATGELLWEFDAGTGCTDCGFLEERNEILSSPAVFEGLVYFGMDINDFGDGKGGFYAVDARDGTLRWYFDVVTGAHCRPDPIDEVRRFDGYHSASALGLADDFFSTREGCGFDRTGVACGNVWSSAAIDPTRRLLYATSSNCDTDYDPETSDPEPPMPPYDEALFALDLDTGKPRWKWRAYEVDNEDLAIGAVPNLFTAEIEGQKREVVGYGQKNGFYYLLDRDGENELTGKIEPYWQTQVVPGGDIGGIIASSAVLDGRIYISTAIGTDLSSPQLPAAFAVDSSDGEILWASPDSMPSYAPTSAIPGVMMAGSLGGSVFLYDAETGEVLNRLPVSGPVSSPSVVADGVLFVGSGTGARGGSPASIAFLTSLLPNPISAFCLSGTEGCPEGGVCDDGNTCTEDLPREEGICRHPRKANGVECSVGAFGGLCQEGFCLLAERICEDDNQCTVDRVTASGCRYEVLPDGTPCVIRDDAGQCRRSQCEKLEPITGLEEATTIKNRTGATQANPSGAATGERS